MTMRMTAMTGNPGAAAYLWEAQACAEEIERDDAELAATRGDSAGYYAAASERGEAPGRVAGEQLRHVGLRDGQVPDKDAALRLLRCQDPATGDQLGRALRTPPPRDERLRAALRAAGEVSEEEARAIARRIDKTGRGGVAFYDVTFAASKSVSVYYALLRQAGRHDLADAVASAHDEAVHYAMRYLEEHTWTRTGTHGRAGGASTGRMEHVGGVIRLHFQHSTSRGRDPHLHTHVGTVNRVRCADGQWRAIHGAAWKPHKAAAAARYEAKVAELIEARTPARLVTREDGMAREIIGLDPELVDASSQRSVQVAEARERFLAEFREQHGRAPTPQEVRRIDRLAGLESRARKDGTGPAQQYRDWQARVGVDPAATVDAVHQAGQAADFWRAPVSADETDRAVVAEALAEVQASASTWDVGVLTALIANRLPAERVEHAAALAREATAPGNAFGVVDLTRRDLPGVPEEVTDARQRPVWRDPALDGAMYALADHLSAEAQLVAAARAHTVAPWTDAEVAALREQWRQSGDTISDQQAAAVVSVLQSPRAGDVLVAAAGTGKSYLAGRLAAAWRAKGGTVMGTATSQIATSVLAAEVGEALNTTRFLQAYGPDHPQAGQRLPAGALILVDEANMTSTDQLRRVQQVAARDGAKVLYFGDPHQLAAVGAGGGLDLMAAELGTVAELDEVRRFAAEWERAASVRLREGDLSALDEYERHGRIHGGTAEAMISAAVDRYVAAMVRGQSAALITATNADAAEVSARVQDRLRTIGAYRDGGALAGDPVAEGMDGNTVRVGDLIQWRENVYDVQAENDDPVINREFLRVIGHDEHGVALRRESDGTRVTVPHSWLSVRAQLGYAGTEHAYEGVTVDVAHTLTPGYVAMTRGREVNEAWLTTLEPGDEHGEAVRTSPRELFEQRFSTEGRAAAALLAWREEVDAERHTATLSAAWESTTGLVMRDATLDAVGAHLGWDAADRVSTERGVATLQEVLTRAVVRGYDYDSVLRQAIEARPLNRVDDLAAVLAWRAQRVMDTSAPERAVATWSDRVGALAERGQPGAFLAHIGRRLDARVTELGARAAAERPAWALAQLGEPPTDESQAVEWRIRAGRIAAYRERAGLSDAVPSLGARPHDADVMQQAAWQDAALAAGRPVDEAEYHALPTSRLEALRARWRRLTAAAPTYVEPELGRAHDAHRQADTDATLLRTMAAAAEAEADRAELIRRAETREQDAAVAAERARMLAELHAVRQEWVGAHEADADAALEAERELKRRGHVLDGPQAEPEQTELFEITTEYEQAERPTEAEAEQTAEVEHGQAALFAVEPRAADVARQQPVAVALDVDQAADQVHSDALAAWEARSYAEATQRTVAEAATRARYAQEMLHRRAEQQAQQAAEAEAERQARVVRDEVAEAEAARTADVAPDLELF